MIRRWTQIDADRRRTGCRVVQIILATLWTVALLLVAFSALAEPFDDQRVAVLVFTKTAGFRHDSIPDGIAAIQTLGRENGFAVEATEDAGRFTDEGLAAYRAVIFLNTTGDVLAADQERAFERYIRGGGGFVGIHSAADTEYGWAWYGDLVGAYFDSHPAIQQGEIHVADRVHPATEHLSARWQRRDEWYNYRRNPRVDEFTSWPPWTRAVTMAATTVLTIPLLGVTTTTAAALGTLAVATPAKATASLCLCSISSAASSTPLE